MPNQKPKKQTRDQDRLEMVLKECGPFLIPCDLSAMFEAIPGDLIYCGREDVALTKYALQSMLEEGRAKISAEYGIVLISAVE